MDCCFPITGILQLDVELKFIAKPARSANGCWQSVVLPGMCVPSIGTIIE